MAQPQSQDSDQIHCSSLLFSVLGLCSGSGDLGKGRKCRVHPVLQGMDRQIPGHHGDGSQPCAVFRAPLTHAATAQKCHVSGQMSLHCTRDTGCHKASFSLLP